MSRGCIRSRGRGYQITVRLGKNKQTGNHMTASTIMYHEAPYIPINSLNNYNYVNKYLV